MKRMLCFLIAVLLLVPHLVGVSNATEPEDLSIGTTDDLVLEELERKATDFITKYINTAYLYSTEEFAEDTLLEHQDEIAVTSIQVDGENHTVANLVSNLQHFEEVANYYKTTRSYLGFQIRDFQLSTSNVSININENIAEVSLFSLVAFRLDDQQDLSYAGNNCTVYFYKLNGNWIIVDIYSEEIEETGLSKNQFDCTSALQLFFENSENMESIDESVIQSFDAETQSVISGNNRRLYYPNNAVAYALTYSTVYYSDGDVTSYRNELFPFHTNANCINFASQCVWAGLSGNNYTDAIQGRNYPMDISGDSATTTWHSDSYSWKTCYGFQTYVEANSSNTSDTTLKANIYDVDSRTSFSGAGIPGAPGSLKGAVLLVQGSGGNFGHAILISSATSNNFEDVKFCGNSPMRQNYTLYYDTTYCPYPMKVIIPQYFQIGTTCATHTYPRLPSVPGGYSTKCSVCGYSDLRIVGQMTAPLSCGTTFTINANTNYDCYRIAINIKHSDGTDTWTEYYNTNTASCQFTFVKTGLYTITVAARDADPEIAENGNATSHVFTIRVY